MGKHRAPMVIHLASSAPRGPEDWISPFILDEARTMNRRGFRTGIVCPRRDRGPSVRENVAGVPVHRVSYLPNSMDRHLAGNSGGMAEAIHTFRGRLEALPLLGCLARATQQEIRRSNADLVVAHWVETALAGLWAARRCGIPCVVRLHRWNPRGVTEDIVGRWVMGRATAFLPNSPFVRDRVALHGCDTPIFIVPPGIDGRFAEPAVVPHRLPIPSGRPVIIAVGRLVPKKGHWGLLEAVAEIRERGRVNPFVLVVGDGPERSRLEGHPVLRGEGGLVAGALGRSVVRSLLAESDVFVQPSRVDGRGESETFGVAVVEAQLAGVPVVVTSSGALPSRVAGGRAGRVVPPDGVAEMAKAIEALLLDPDKRTTLGEEGRRVGHEQMTQAEDALVDAMRRCLDLRVGSR